MYREKPVRTFSWFSIINVRNRGETQPGCYFLHQEVSQTCVHLSMCFFVHAKCIRRAAVRKTADELNIRLYLLVHC